MRKKSQTVRRDHPVERSWVAATTVEEALLSPQRAFVVQFRAGAEQEHFAGRVEHMTSGRAVRFSSREELLAFLSEVLKEQPREYPG